jgi:hypothetical protein
MLVSGFLIVLRDALAHLAGGYTHDGVCIGVVVAVPIKYRHAQGALLKKISMAGEGLLDDESEEHGVAPAVAEVLAVDDTLQLLQQLYARELFDRVSGDGFLDKSGGSLYRRVEALA